MTGRALDQNFTMDEAADWLRISRRQLQALVKRHPVYYANGNRKLFGEGDLIALREAMRRDGSPCRSSSSRQGQGKRRTGNLPLANDIEVRQFGRQPCNAGDISTVQDAIVPRRIVADDERSPLPLEFYKAVIHGARPRETHRGALVRP